MRPWMLPASLLVLTAAAVWMYADRRQRLDAQAEASDARWRELNDKLENLQTPKGRPGAKTARPEQRRPLRVFLARFDHDDRARARTEILLNRDVSWPLPVGWKGRAGETEARIASYDEAFDALETALEKEREARKATGAALAPTLRVEHGVPREDVLKAAAVLVRLELEPISVEGAEPLTEEERATLAGSTVSDG